MVKLKRPKTGNKKVTTAVLMLVVFGSLMIASAEMGNSVGDTSYLYKVIGKQIAYSLVGLIAYFVCTNIDIHRYPLFTYYAGYVIILFLLVACRAFGQINGAYAWIPIGSVGTFQPSEFAKVFMIAFGGKLFNGKEKNIISNFKTYAAAAVLYFFVILVIQKDFGSALVLLVICFCVAFIPQNIELRKYHKWMRIIIYLALLVIVVVFSPIGDSIIDKLLPDGYMKGRFFAASNPFKYQYDYGYHVIMALVSFANGGLFGLGYGNSIHKYMNFPNPSNDFILPVIVEELGYVGFVCFIIVYGVMLFPIIRCSLKTESISSKVVLLGTFTYIIVHFILNVGGVSGFIPLTGVPILLISSGGSSLVACLCAIGLAQAELIRNKGIDDESNSR